MPRQIQSLLVGEAETVDGGMRDAKALFPLISVNKKIR